MLFYFLKMLFYFLKMLFYFLKMLFLRAKAFDIICFFGGENIENIEKATTVCVRARYKRALLTELKKIVVAFFLSG